jgi:hypothetical protein
MNDHEHLDESIEIRDEELAEVSGGVALIRLGLGGDYASGPVSSQPSAMPLFFRKLLRYL